MMAEGRLQAEWSQTAELLAITYNMHRGPKSRPIPSWKFSPFGRETRTEAPDMGHDESWEAFRGLFDRGAFGGRP
jgi:hypothetical protein